MFPALYHVHHQLNLEDLPFWQELAAQAQGPILELGCGTGRVLLPLFEAGYPVFGLDHDRAMLAYLRHNAHEARLTAPAIFLADLAHFHLGVKFALILLPCNTFSTLDDKQQQDCLSCVQRHLLPGGLFVVSLPNPQMLLQLPTRSEPELEDEFPHPHTGNPVLVSSGWRRSRGTFHLTWVYDQLFPDGKVERLQIETSHTLQPLAYYQSMLARHGLHLEHAYGDFDRSTCSPVSPQLILQAAGEY